MFFFLIQVLLCACTGAYVFGVENVSAYIFHDEYFVSFKRVLVQGRRPCFRRLYRRLCFMKCKRLHCIQFFVHHCTRGQRLDKWTKHWTQIGQNRNEIGQMDKQLDKWTKRGQQWTNCENP